MINDKKLYVTYEKRNKPIWEDEKNKNGGCFSYIKNT